ncbi:MAG: cobyrinate a,c-diamide synthase [Candidatus Schekmanbacteria bacterium]|nr:cobyrinate a,c-diamide synthase [Candidatus Schekmanbacteria bacterium]
MPNPPRLMLAATHSGAGKTTITAGIISAFRQAGKKVQPFKSGPDYIDPGYHSLAAQNPCRNLDTWLLSSNTISELFAYNTGNADIAVIEGAMGLYDGVQGQSGCGSSADLAKLLKIPVILVVDAKGLGQSAAAIVLGYREMDKQINLAGVILNRVGSSSHYQLLKTAIEEKTGLPVLGGFPRCEDLILPERHLGLIPQIEQNNQNFWGKLQEITAKHIDINRLWQIAAGVPPLPSFTSQLFTVPPLDKKIPLAVAYDQTFHFYYHDNLDLLKYWGAEILYFSPLKDKNLPEGCCGLYIGGGYPELFAEQLSANQTLLEDIRRAHRQSMPIYAECGGLMYLTQGITAGDGNYYPLASLLPVKTKMTDRRQALGYVRVKVQRDNLLSLAGEELRGHEFHWSTIDDLPEHTAYQLYNSRGEKRSLDGLTANNLLASYTHLHFASYPLLGQRFLQACKKIK